MYLRTEPRQAGRQMSEDQELQAQVFATAGRQEANLELPAKADPRFHDPKA